MRINWACLMLQDVAVKNNNIFLLNFVHGILTCVKARVRMISRIMFISFLILSSVSYASNFDSGVPLKNRYSSYFDQFDELDPKPSQFLAPNETQPKDLLPILVNAQKGVYVSVGTERGFMAAGLSGAITDLVLVDLDPSIAFYNTINIELLKAAKNREQYVYLRTKATESDWQTALNGLVAHDQIAKQWEWWRDAVLPEARMDVFHIDPTKSKYPNPSFEDANYLYLEKNFKRVKRLADHDRVQVLEADIKNSKVLNLFERFKKSGQQISVIDISNLYGPGHAGAKYTAAFLESIKPLVDKKTILVYTIGRGDSSGEWFYVGFRFGKIWHEGVYKFVDENLKQRPPYLNRYNHSTFFEGEPAYVNVKPQNQSCGRILRSTGPRYSPTI